MKIGLLIISLSLCFLISSKVISSEFKPWSENVFDQIEQEFGKEAEERVRLVHSIILENQDLPDIEKVKLINTRANNLPWIADSNHWKNSDYWASPLETLATFGGDCEDIAIVKWVVLHALGIPANHLRLGYVKIKKTNENHMILLYLENPDAPHGQRGVWVLDNYVAELKRAEDREDLLAIFTTDHKGNMRIVNDDGQKRSIKVELKERKYKSLDELKVKIRETRAKYQEFNEGRPLMPPVD